MTIALSIFDRQWTWEELLLAIFAAMIAVHGLMTMIAFIFTQYVNWILDLHRTARRLDARPRRQSRPRRNTSDRTEYRVHAGRAQYQAHDKPRSRRTRRK